MEDTHAQIEAALSAIARASVEVYDSYAYATGYFTSVIQALARELPEKRRRELIEDLNAATVLKQSKLPA